MATESLFEAIGWEVAQRKALKDGGESAKYLPALRTARHGDFSGALGVAAGVAVNDALGKAMGKLTRKLNGGGGGAPAAKPPMLLGGITLEKAREIFQKSSSVNFAKKNLFYVSVIDVAPGGGELADFNLFATDASYSPVTITGDKVNVGSGVFDVPKTGDSVSLRLTTMDDERGTLKRWFKDRASRVCRPDGTHGLPISYLLRVRIVHAFISDTDEVPDAFFDEYIMRPGSIEYDLSRRDDALQELQMTFEQFDTFGTFE